MEPVVPPAAPWMTVWPALPALALALWGGWRLRGAGPPAWGVWVAVLGALVVRALGLPLERHIFDGHEADYLEIFLGSRPLTRGGPMLYPAVQWLYAGLGRLTDEPRALLGLNLLASSAAVGLVYAAVARRLGPVPGAVAAAWLGLWGNHVAWAGSAYNVTLPHTMVALAVWALLGLGRGLEPWGAGALAGGALALALALRVESAVVLPALGLYGLVERPRGALRALPGLALGLALGGVAAALVLWPGQTPGEEQRALAWSINRGLLAYFAPWDRPWSWVALALGLGLLGRAWPAGAALAGGLVLGGHLAGASFDDYGARHLLNAGLGLALLGAGLGLRGWGRVLAVGVVGLLGVDLLELRARFYAAEERFAETLDPALPRWSPAELPACAWICEDSRLVPEGQQRSHFNLWDPAEAEALRQAHGCVIWLRGAEDWRWSSRAVADRATRLGRLYTLTPLAVVVDPERGYVAEVNAVGPRRVPGPLDPASPGPASLSPTPHDP